ncbi:MAG: cytochrome c-type biogenesis protein [Steroidobacteraceae bacterium]
MKRICFMLACLFLSGSCAAIDTSEPFADPKLQARYLVLTHELRCVQCQNESIADSPVEIAADLRREVREKISSGMSNQQIRELMVSRYGEYILFKPRWSARNALLWLAPGLMLIGGGIVGWRVLRRRRALLTDDDTPLDEDAGQR